MHACCRTLWIEKLKCAGLRMDEARSFVAVLEAQFCAKVPPVNRLASWSRHWPLAVGRCKARSICSVKSARSWARESLWAYLGIAFCPIKSVVKV